MILTCPQCANRYHVDRPSKTAEILASCPSCGHKWLFKVKIIEPLILEEEKTQEIKSDFLEKCKKNQKIIFVVVFICLIMGYILQPLVKSGIESLLSLLKIQETQKSLLVVENIDHFFDESSQTVTISWELKNDTNTSQNLKRFRIQLFNKCPKDQGDCLLKEINFNPNKDIILPKEILRFEHTQKWSIPVTKIYIFP